MRLSNRKSRFILNKALYLAVSVILFGGLALTANAQSGQPQAIPNDYGLTETAKNAGLPVGETNPIKIVATVVNTLLGFLGTLLVILIIYAGFLWMTAAGEEQKISKAKKLLGNAIIGLLIILTSYAIASFTIINLKKATQTSNNSASQTQTCSGAGGYCAVPPCAPNTNIGKYNCQGAQTCCRGDST